MRRTFEVALVVLVLVAVPIGVSILARSEPTPKIPRASAIALARPILAFTHLTPTRCAWTHNGANVECAVAGAGKCTLHVRLHTGTCADGTGGISESLTFQWDESAP
jgi:hypothetical protein